MEKTFINYLIVLYKAILTYLCSRNIDIFGIVPPTKEGLYKSAVLINLRIIKIQLLTFCPFLMTS